MRKINNKGGVREITGAGFGLIMVIIIAMVIVLLAAAWNMGFGLVTHSLQQIQTQNNSLGLNISYVAGTVVFGNLNAAFQQLQWISIGLIFGMMLGIFVSNFIVKSHPAFFGLYIVVAILAVFFAIFISNSFENIYNSAGVYGSALQSFTGASWLVINLPLVISILAFIGGVFLFVNMGQERGGGII